MYFSHRILALPDGAFSDGSMEIRPIKDDNDLWYATVECRLLPGQEELVNPAGFSIGRAYLAPEDNLPCIIWHGGRRVGYIVLRRWPLANNAATWSYFIDRSEQGKGYGTAAALLAIMILKAAHPEYAVKLSAEPANTSAHRLYRSVGFRLSDELDGDDLVFVYE